VTPARRPAPPPAERQADREGHRDAAEPGAGCGSLHADLPSGRTSRAPGPGQHDALPEAQ
jgi:hypothetical protein